jgi:hypothetical protein
MAINVKKFDGYSPIPELGNQIDYLNNQRLEMGTFDFILAGELFDEEFRVEEEIDY